MNQQRLPNQKIISDPLAEELITTLKNMPNPARLIDDMQESVAKEEAVKVKEQQEEGKEVQKQTEVLAAENILQDSSAPAISEEEERHNTHIVQDDETLLDQYLKEQDPDKKSELRIQVKDSFSKLLQVLGERSLSPETRKRVESELMRITTTFFVEGAVHTQELDEKKEENQVVTIKPQAEHTISVPLPLQFAREAKQNEPIRPPLQNMQDQRPLEDKKEPDVPLAVAPIPPMPSVRLAPLTDVKISSTPVQQEKPIVTTSILEQAPNPGWTDQVGVKSETPVVIPPPGYHNDPYSHESHIVTVNDGSKGPGPTLLAIPQRSKDGVFSSFRSIFKK